jgi:YggT family protein
MNFISTFIRILCDALTVAIFARVIISWFPVNPGNRLVELLYQVTEPILAPLRRIIPRVGMIDITPWIAIILLRVIAGLV